MSIYNDYHIYFYNNFHNGDVFYAKEFVRDIKNQIGIDHKYIHHNSKSILKDFDIEQINTVTPDNSLSLSKRNDSLYINTWIGQGGGKYLKYDCSLKSNYLIYTDIFKALDLEIKPIEFYIPDVDFSKVNKIELDKNKKYVLVCNNNVHSGQASNINLDPVIDSISDIYRGINFIMTNHTNLNKINVVKAENILGTSVDNLLEISYLSTQTDIIIGRGSGPFCFSHIKTNMNNPDKTFISFTYKEDEGKWVPDESSKAKQYWFNKFEYNEMINDIINVLKNKI